jgi:predicted nucleotidyltransferase component of viral defense system
MNLFDALVNQALKNVPTLSPLRIVVEKELLHHDILKALSQHQLLAGLTFTGGTCLRSCYGGIRLSEDLDFTGGSHFTRDQLSNLGQVLVESFQVKYGLTVKVSEPSKEQGNVDTWKVKIETRPEQPHLPAQRINIDICAIPSYEKQPMMLLNPYGVDMGTSGLILQAQSREEIYADKILAFALRPNRIKHRDLWDIVWLHQQGLKPRWELIPQKLQDRHLSAQHFFTLFEERRQSLTHNKKLPLEFHQEIQRFFPVEQLKQLEQQTFWTFLIYLMNELSAPLRATLNT